jgi:hypothetical protein
MSLSSRLAASVLRHPAEIDRAMDEKPSSRFAIPPAVVGKRSLKAFSQMV